MAFNQPDPFRHKDPPLFDATVLSIVDGARALIEGTVSLCDDIVVQVRLEEATFENTIRPLANNENVRSEKEHCLRFYAVTSPSPELREASSNAAKMFHDADISVFSHRDLFILVDQVKQRVEGGLLPRLDDQSWYYLRKLHQRFSAHGCGIVNALLRGELVAKQKRLNDLAQECRKNTADERTGLWLTRNELDGVPESLLNQLIVGDGQHAGHLWLPTQASFVLPVMTNATQETTRKKVYYAVINRMPRNIPIFREMILLRDETARKLGWRNHFSFKTSQKMVQNPETVSRLMCEIRTTLTPFAQQLAEQLLQLKRKETEVHGPPTGGDLKLFFWDRKYYQKQLHDNTRTLDTLTSEYFELDTTLQKLLNLYEHLFGVRLFPIDTTAHAMSGKKLVWHDDVRMFSAWKVDDDERPEFLAYVYLDIFPREGKSTHVRQYALQRRYLKTDGSWFDPCSCLVMNYAKPTDDPHPTLLSLQEVRKLFHELGHMYHSVLSRARYARLHAVDSDFVEVPSIMLERFLWDPQVIRDISFHYSHINPAMRHTWLSTLAENQNATGIAAEMPVQLSLAQASELARDSTTNNLHSVLNDLFFATYDMRIHSPATHAELERTDLSAIFNQTRAEIYHMHGAEAEGEGWAFGHGQTVFRAIQDKYDAGYYAYVFGRLFALNLFQAGFAHDLMSKEAGRRYRDMVLCKGGRQPEMQTLTDYLGHQPSTAPLFDWLGLYESNSSGRGCSCSCGIGPTITITTAGEKKDCFVWQSENQSRKQKADIGSEVFRDRDA